MAIPLSSSQSDLSLSHRLPTLSATQALKDLDVKRSICTGIASFDQALSGHSPSALHGFQRGKISEIWGPTGAGKTALLFQTAQGALQSGGQVVWIDGSTPLSATRLRLMRESVSVDVVPESFCYLSLGELSRLLALVLYPPDSFPQSASLLVIDGLDVLIDIDFPRMPWTAGSKTEQQKWLAGRRYAVLGALTSGLNKLAAVHNMAVVVTTGCGTRVRSEYGFGAAIAPGIGGSEWEVGVWSRAVMFRDFNGRFLGIQKCRGRNFTPLDPVGEIGTVVHVEMAGDGMLRQSQVNTPPATQNEGSAKRPGTTPSPLKPAKKRFYGEIADSDDEGADEYGWIDFDEGPLTSEGLVDEHANADERIDDEG